MKPKNTLANIPRILGILVASMFLTSCYSIFDPAPYSPQFDSDFVQKHPNIIQFTTLSDARTDLNILAVAYAEEGGSLMREQLGLDVPLFGLAAATVASGIYGGSKDLTLGLGLGSAGFAGTKLYFNPQARAAAYYGPALALNCGAFVANELWTIMITEDPSGIATTLQSLLDAASNSKDQNVATLVSAGQKALNDLIVAIGIINGRRHDCKHSPLPLFGVRLQRPQQGCRISMLRLTLFARSGQIHPQRAPRPSLPAPRFPRHHRPKSFPSQKIFKHIRP